MANGGSCSTKDRRDKLVAGRFKEGVAELRRCVEIDPLSSYNTAVLGAGLGIAGYHEEAIDQVLKATQLDPDSYVSRWSCSTKPSHSLAVPTRKGSRY